MQPAIKLLAFDMDGTVLTDEKEISPRTQAALRKAREQGLEIVATTGRASDGIPKAFMEVGEVRYAVTANGARVVDFQTGECFYEVLMERELALKAFDLLQKYDCVLDVFQNGKGYSTPANLKLSRELLPEHVCNYVVSTRTVVEDLRVFVETQEQGIEKWTMFFRDEAERDIAWKEMETLGVEVVSSLPRNMELTARGADKGSGLVALTEKLGISLSQVFACGDGGNDISMLRVAGVSVAMENAPDNVKAAAQYVTADNNHEGVAQALEQYVFSTSL